MGRKRKSGEGTIRLRKDGRWEGRVVVGYDDKGLPKTKNVLAKTKTECVAKLEYQGQGLSQVKRFSSASRRTTAKRGEFPSSSSRRSLWATVSR